MPLKILLQREDCSASGPTTGKPSRVDFRMRPRLHVSKDKIMNVYFTYCKARRDSPSHAQWSQGHVLAKRGSGTPSAGAADACEERTSEAPGDDERPLLSRLVSATGDSSPIDEFGE